MSERERMREAKEGYLRLAQILWSGGGNLIHGIAEVSFIKTENDSIY